jgi:uncharacterized membrane protein/protein-disulfide isomerase
MTPRSRWLALGFALVGLAFAAAATYVHYRLLTEPNYVSPCDINARFSCSEVYLSRFGAIAGVPVALGGVFFFGLVTLTILLSDSRPHERDDALGAYLFALSTIGLASVLYLGWASFFVLHKGCVLCIGTYVSVIGLFIVSGLSGAMPMSRLPGRLASDLADLVRRPVQLFVSLLFVVVAISMAGCFPKEQAAASAKTSTPGASGGSAEEAFDAIWAQQPRVDLGIPADGAKVVIVKFNDWQCPSCKAAHQSYKPMLDKWAQTQPGVIKYVVKDYPLNNKCNFNVPGQNHPGACEAAAAVRLANEQGKGDAMIDWLFAHQETLTPQSVADEAKTLLGTADFSKEYARLVPDIKRDAADGGALNVAYTPTFYINGVKAQGPEGGWLSPQNLEFAIQYEIKKAGGK